MPRVPAPGGNSGLPRLTTLAFQLIDAGYDIYSAIYLALGDYFALLIYYYGQQLVADIGEIG